MDWVLLRVGHRVAKRTRYLSPDTRSTFACRCSLPQQQNKALRTVIKFGGSSLATGTRLKEVAALVKLLISQGQTPTMVCSAMGKTTNNLLNAGEFALSDGKVIGCLTAREA